MKFAVWYRRSRSLLSARRMMRARSRGRLGLSSVTDLGVSLTIEEMIEMLVSPVNGRCPVAQGSRTRRGEGVASGGLISQERNLVEVRR